MHHYFPLSGLFLTSIPKAGNTSTRSFFLAIECALEEASISGVTPTSLSYLEKEMSIHSNPQVWSYSVSPKSRKVPKSAIKVVALRHPLERTLSMWIDKVVLAEDAFMLAAFGDQDWFPNPNYSIKEMQECLILFLKKLRDPVFLASDIHWIPQITFTPSIDEYTYILTTDNLSQLPEMLSEQPHLSWLRNIPIPQFHRTEPTIKSYLFTQEVRDLVKEIYESDFNLLHSTGLYHPSPLENDQFVNRDLNQDSENWKSIQRQAELSRINMISELSRQFQRSRASYENSRSWRMTAPLRYLARRVRDF